MDIVFDCRYAPALARWWVQVLEGYTIAPYTVGDPDPDEDPAVLVLPGPAGGPRLWFTQVPERTFHEYVTTPYRRRTANRRREAAGHPGRYGSTTTRR
jgi:hypothetical protein